MGDTALVAARTRAKASPGRQAVLPSPGPAGTTLGGSGASARRDRSARVGAYTAALRQIVPVFAWAVFPILLTLLALLTEARMHKFTGDYYFAFWPAGRSILHGTTPYVDANSTVIAHSTAFVYPAVAALAMAPLALMSRVAGDEVFTALDIAAVLLTLRVLQVRDWRLYGAVLLWPAVFAGWYTSNVTLLLGLGLALAWRYRDRAAISGLVIALLISFKLFLWPLAVWLIATRRYAALAWGLVAGLAINAVAWTVLGFGELHRYTRLLHALTSIEGHRGYSVIAFALNHGADRVTAYAVALALAGLALVGCVTIARRGNQEGAFALAIAASLLATPLLWLHYFALLIVPLAIARPRLSAIWVLPLVTWLYPVVHPAGWQVIVALAVAALLVTSAISRTRPPRLGMAA